MGTRKSKHNKGRKPLYKEYRRHLVDAKFDEPEQMPVSPISKHKANYKIPKGGAGRSHIAAILRRPIEVVSVPQILERPRFPNGAPLAARTHWARPDSVALKALCEAAADLERSAFGLGRTPRNLVSRASDTGLRLPPEWWDYLYPNRIERRIERERRKEQREKERRSREPFIPTAYPYIKNVNGEYSDLLAVNDLVPARMPEHIRADVCQELMLAILEGETSVESLRRDPALIKKYVKAYYKDNCEIAGWAISLDRPLPDGRSWYDVLPDARIDTETETLHSFEELAEAFPSVIRSHGGAQLDTHYRTPTRPERCQHGIATWNHCERCERQYQKTLLAREESHHDYG